MGSLTLLLAPSCYLLNQELGKLILDSGLNLFYSLLIKCVLKSVCFRVILPGPVATLSP